MKTTSYEISKKLKEAGFEAQSSFFWCRLDKDLIRIHISQSHSVPESIDKIKAYDLETIFDALPKINKQEYLLCSGGIVYLNDDYISVGKEKNESLADTAGKMWLLLKEKLGRKAS